MDRNSVKAKQFVVVTEKRKPPKSEQDIGSIEVKTYVVDPTTSVAEIFSKVFQGADGFNWSASLDRVSIYPDETTVPEDEMLATLKQGRTTGDENPFEFE